MSVVGHDDLDGGGDYNDDGTFYEFDVDSDFDKDIDGEFDVDCDFDKYIDGDFDVGRRNVFTQLHA